MCKMLSLSSLNTVLMIEIEQVLSSLMKSFNFEVTLNSCHLSPNICCSSHCSTLDIGTLYTHRQDIHIHKHIPMYIYIYC